jgi:6-phosphogluconolactonase
MNFKWVRRVPDKQTLARTAADEVLQLSNAAIDERGVFRVALGGGSTPRGMYELLSDSMVARFDRWHFYWGDERCVPSDHTDSNFLLAQQTLLGRIPLLDHQIHRVRTEIGRPGEVASDYEDELRRSFDCSKGGIPRFDLLLLGLGADGHTASLFPKSAALNETSCLVTATQADLPQSDRITLTLPVINEARAVIFTVAGSGKASALQAVLKGLGKPQDFPARLVVPRDGTVLWVADEAALGSSRGEA